MNEDTLQQSWHQKEAERREKMRSALWDMAGILYAWRRFILGMTVLFAVVAIGISLLLPKWYLAQTRLLSPESSGTNPLSAALSSNLSAAASAIFGQQGGDFFRYISILSSRSMFETVVDKFDLVEVYETGESQDPKGSAIRILADNASFPIDNEYEFLSVSVLDTDPQRAAEMANFFVEELNRRNQELASQDAANYRNFVENRYEEALIELDSLKDATQKFQEEFGVFDLETQASSFLEQVADIRAEAITFEIEYAALRAQYGAENSSVKAARDAYEAANQKSEDALQGREDILPISQKEMPGVFRAYVELEQEVLIQKSILEIIAPMDEQARFQDERQFQAVQVVDLAVPPTRKAKPKRSLIVIGATLSAFMLTVLFVMAYSWWQRNHADILHRLQEAAARSK